MENRKMKCTGACVHPREGFIEIFVVFVVFVVRIRKPLDIPQFFVTTELPAGRYRMDGTKPILFRCHTTRARRIR